MLFIWYLCSFESKGNTKAYANWTNLSWVDGVCFVLRVLASDSSGFPQSKPTDDSRLLYDVPTDDPVQSRPMPPCYAHEPPDAGTRARPGLAVGVLQG